MRSFGTLIGLLLLLGLVVFCAPRSDCLRIVVLVSVDQLMRETPPRYLDHLDGGIRRVYDDGLVFTRARLAHGVTETGPGHSIMLSGRDPRETGIVSNTWFRIGDGGRYVRVYSGSVGLAVPTLADAVLERGGRVLSISGKDRALYVRPQVHQARARVGLVVQLVGDIVTRQVESRETGRVLIHERVQHERVI